MRIIICAAGLGSRLGFNIPKCLVEVNGRTIIHRQLEILTCLTSDIIIVGGFKLEQVIEAVKDFGVKVVYNKNYATTSVVDSIGIGLVGTSGEVVTIDGDVLFTKPDIIKLLAMPGDVACVKNNISNDNPVYVTTDETHILAFHRDKKTSLEWTGICKVPSKYFDAQNKFVFECLEHHLPIRYLLVDSAEIDSVKDLEEAEKWINK